MTTNNTADNMLTSTTLLAPIAFVIECSSEASYKNQVIDIRKVYLLVYGIDLYTLMGSKVENYSQEKQTTIFISVSDKK